MASNLWIENSRKVYTLLLNLYPQDHRAEYGLSMQQVFTDQCRGAYQQKGVLGMVLLWLRTLPDLGSTALLEQLTSPRLGWGLMEPVPNSPLPWKGVFLVLLPGLVYLVSQIAQLTGQPWYMTVYYRAAFFLILPVLVVWAITRRFPIWGLIPVGLLYRLLKEIGYQLIVLHPDAFSSNPLLNAVLILAKQVQKELVILVVVFTAAILVLLWRYTRQQKPSRIFWALMGIYVLAAILQCVGDLGWITKLEREIFYYTNDDIFNMVKNSITWNLYDSTAFLCLIFLGTLFTRRHGFFAILIPVGYILPTIVVGLPWNLQDAINPEITLTVISFAVLAYRSLLSLVAPIWMSRTSSQSGKKRAVLVSIVLALGIHAVMQFYQFFLYAAQVFTAQWVAFVVLDEIKLISAVALGVVMYQSASTVINLYGNMPAESSEFSAEKV